MKGNFVSVNKDQRVCCTMPCRSVPNAHAFKALQVAAVRANAPFDTPAREPRERNRNICVSQFLENKDYDWMLFVDDDTAIPSDAIEKLLSADKKIVCGMQPLLLPAKDDNYHMVANVMPFPTVMNTRPHWPDWVTWQHPIEPFPVMYCGFGCVLMHREPLEAMDFPIWFCDHARRAGYDIWCQPSVICSHYKVVDLLDVIPRCRVDLTNK